MTREQFVTWAKAQGYVEDKYGHLVHSTTGGKAYRMKVSRIAVRHEVKARIGDTNEWLRIRSAYLKDLTVDASGVLHGMTR